MVVGQGLAQSHKLLGVADALSRVTHFNVEENKVLVQFHQRLVACNGLLDRLRFRDVLNVTFDITDDIMLDLTFKAFDRDNDGYVDEHEWAKGLSSMIRGSLEELVEFVYFVYDMNGDRSLAREELYHCLKGCMYPGYGVDIEDLEECERDIVEIAMKKLDVDRDGQITFNDFQNAVINDPLMLQACGPCLPSAKKVAAFLALVTFKYRSYTGVWAVPWGSPAVEKLKRRTSFVSAKKAARTSVSTGNILETSASNTLAILYQSKLNLNKEREQGSGAPNPNTAVVTPNANPPKDNKGSSGGIEAASTLGKASMMSISM